MKLMKGHRGTQLLQQISRFFSALGLWFGLGSLVLFNVAMKATVNPERSDAITSIFPRPYTPQPHVSFAKLLRQEDRLEPAVQELRVAAELAAKTGAPSNVLGATTDPASLLETWATEADRMAAAYRYWRGVASEKPDYRDAQLQAATLALQQSDTSEARRFAQATLDLDPNNVGAQQLLNILAKK